MSKLLSLVPAGEQKHIYGPIIKDELEKKIIETGRTLYGERKKGEYCSFCGNHIGDGYCYCLDSLKINTKARKINKKFETLSRLTGERCVPQQLQTLINESNLPVKFLGRRFDSYKVENESQRQGLLTVQEYSDKCIENWLDGRNLMLTGNFGTGKTLLSSIVGQNSIYSALLAVKYINIEELTTKVIDTFSKTSTITTEKLLNEYKKPDLLILDDIDKKSPSKFVVELMYGLINYRIEKELPIVISMNSSFEQLDKDFFGEASVSRLYEDSAKVIFTHENWRLKN